MKSKFQILNLLTFILVFIFPVIVCAEIPNNKYGIHLAQPHLEEFPKIKEMVNTNGGDWGYVTLVIQENDRKSEKWQEVFDRLRENHLIPIIRIATQPEGENWRRPDEKEADDWVNFLNSLNWVVKNRYVILFNEVNHGAEWGGEADPQNYAETVVTYAEKLKKKNPDFFIMLAGLDASAPQSPPNYYEEETFLREVFKSDLENCLELRNSCLEFLIDGISSHSYPNPGFSGSPYDFGRGTIRTYQWEIELFRELTGKNLPVFITETGWKRIYNSEFRIQNYEEDRVAQDFKIAYENVWGPDDRVRAVTPFVYDYQDEPFLGFSWKLPSAEASEEQRNFYPQYYLVQSLTKVKGQPEQIEAGSLAFDFPKELVAQSSYHFRLKLKNTGQAIWDRQDGYQLKLESSDFESNFFSDLVNVKPNQETDIDFYFKTKKTLENMTTKIVLAKEEKPVLQSAKWSFIIGPLPKLIVKASLYPKLKTQANDFELQIFDEKQELVFKRKNIKVENNLIGPIEVQNIALERKYRLVILKPYYLPRQEFLIFKKWSNKVTFRPMYPIDFNSDGKADWQDLSSLIKNPKLLLLLLP